MLGGGGVDGAIQRAAGRELLAACRPLGGCRVGEAKITPGFRLRARFVIHTVGPVWNGGHRGERELLASCYRTSRALAREHQLERVAFPAISTCADRFPAEEAAAIACRTIAAELAAHELPRAVVLVGHGAADAEILRNARDGLSA